MVSDDIFKRRRNHNNTPKYALLIITNYVVCCTLFTLDAKLNWFFGLTIILLGVYNYFNIRRNIEEFTKPVIIAYAISLVGLVLLYFIAHNQL
ncbi:MAG: hypothetical protein JWQ34_1952 [Mucilaginibacter sp.]|uniref:hypothetical protein n=1 Tax=Mucilaginibacter sp. TaxID=1882438 RepID=UPI002636BDB8|nr:hypothetical protein [Mucilaginibacter sp.]MDB5003727.1 hypothetical protein [Mucilaginibacter sp.]